MLENPAAGAGLVHPTDPLKGPEEPPITFGEAMVPAQAPDIWMPHSCEPVMPALLSPEFPVTTHALA